MRACFSGDWTKQHAQRSANGLGEHHGFVARPGGSACDRRVKVTASFDNAVTSRRKPARKGTKDVFSWIKRSGGLSRSSSEDASGSMRPRRWRRRLTTSSACPR